MMGCSSTCSDISKSMDSGMGTRDTPPVTREKSMAGYGRGGGGGDGCSQGSHTSGQSHITSKHRRN